MAAASLLFTKQGLSDEAKGLLLNSFWQNTQVTSAQLDGSSYSALISFIQDSMRDVEQYEKYHAAKTVSHFCQVVRTMREHSALPRHDLVAHLQGVLPDPDGEKVKRTMEFAVRLWLNVHVETPTLAVGNKDLLVTNVGWPEDQSLPSMLAGQFSSRHVPAPTTVISSDLTAAGLKKLRGVEIRYTNNLVDHLRLSGHRARWVLDVYQHKACLVNFRKERKDQSFPPELIEETLRTLELLFPFGNKKAKKMLKEEKMMSLYTAEEDIPEPRKDGIASYTYWRNRLLTLQDLLDRPPETVYQTIRDRRNLSSWTALWGGVVFIFILTLLFGILATVYTIKQYALAVRSYELSERAYDLSLAIACQDATEPLRRFCTQ